MVELLTPWSPHKLLKNLGALSEYAKCIQTKIKKMKFLPTLYPGYDGNGMVKKPSDATVPLNRGYSTVRNSDLMVMAMSL
jgi:hypothetical protein